MRNNRPVAHIKSIHTYSKGILACDGVYCTCKEKVRVHGNYTGHGLTSIFFTVVVTGKEKIVPIFVSSKHARLSSILPTIYYTHAQTKRSG